MNLKKYRERKWRTWFRVVHRDMGYFIFGLTVLYAISGITLNHINDFNPNYIVDNRKIDLSEQLQNLDEKSLIKAIDPSLIYKKHINREDGSTRIFVQGGLVDVEPEDGKIYLEILHRRPFFYEINFLHYNRNQLWIWFSDVFAVILIIVSLSGLFLVKGKYGLSRYGIIWALLGIAIPSVFLLMVL